MLIKPKYVNPPKKANGKYGNVKTAEGKTYFVLTEALGQFLPGASYDVTIEPQTWGSDGVEVITKINGAGGNANANIADKNPTAQQGADTARAYSPAPSKDGLSIFVTGVVGRAMGSGNFKADEIRELTASARGAFEAHLKGV